MSPGPLPDKTLDLVLALHAGVLELESIEDASLREQVVAAHRELLETSDPDASEHLPAWLLAQWPRVADQLSTLEREAVESHLADCGECTADLAVLTGIREQPPRVAPRASPRRGSWLLVGWAVAATAASLFLWFRAPSLPDPALTTANVLLPATVRGQTGVPSLMVPRGTTQVDIDLEQVFPVPLRREIREQGTQTVLFLARGVDPSVALVPWKMGIEDFSRDPHFVLKGVRGEALGAGRYRCTTWLLQGESGAAGTGFSFDLVVGAPD